MGLFNHWAGGVDGHTTMGHNHNPTAREQTNADSHYQAWPRLPNISGLFEWADSLLNAIRVGNKCCQLWMNALNHHRILGEIRQRDKGSQNNLKYNGKKQTT